MTAPGVEVLLAGAGAIGSRLALALTPGVTLTCIDRQRVSPENLGVAAFSTADLGRPKASAVADRRRAAGGHTRSLVGDVRYTLRPGLARALDAALICLDNPAAIRDAAEALWAARVADLPVLVLTCGSDGAGHQARMFVAPGLCPVCLFGAAERHADALAHGTTCLDTTAPRAAAAAAQAAAETGASLLKRWRAGDRTAANCRLQCDAGGPVYVIRMPEAAAPACPVTHAGSESTSDVVALGGSIVTVMVGDLAETAIHCAGADAMLLLDRRAVPLAGLYCPRCGATAPESPRLRPAAEAAWRGCRCGVTPQLLGERTRIDARSLLESDVASLPLIAWGAGHGDEFVVVGSDGCVRLQCTFAWEDIDGQ